MSKKREIKKPYKVLGCAALIFVNVSMYLDIKYYSAIYIAVVTWCTACLGCFTRQDIIYSVYL